MTRAPRLSDMATYEPIDGKIPIDDLNPSKRRTRRARVEPMIVVPESKSNGECTGIYDVISGSGETYPITLNQPDACLCSDTMYNQPRNGCKHRRRVILTITNNNIPSPGSDVSIYMKKLSAAYKQEIDFIGPSTKSLHEIMKQLEKRGRLDETEKDIAIQAPRI